MIDISDFMDNNISDELLAAYIDGNTSSAENVLIENSITIDGQLSEVLDIASDYTTLGNKFDWELHQGDFGFWELGLPPVITEDDIKPFNNVGLISEEVLFANNSSLNIDEQSNDIDTSHSESNLNDY